MTDTSTKAGEEAIPSAVAEVVEALRERFGPNFSNGIVAILLHKELPREFGKECWAEWTFRPSPGAFDWAHDHGLIVPWKLTSKWVFTDLGTACAAYFQALLAQGKPNA